MNYMQSNAYSPPILKFSNYRKQTENNPQIDKPGSKSGFHNGFRLTWENMKDYHNQPKSREYWPNAISTSYHGRQAWQIQGGVHGFSGWD